MPLITRIVGMSRRSLAACVANACFSFETVTYVLAGRMCHKDSQGHSGELNPGDVQWFVFLSGVALSFPSVFHPLPKGCNYTLTSRRVFSSAG